MKARGNATVEVSILMPMLCVLIILLMYLGFYLYDRTVLYADSYLAALQGVSDADMTNEEAYRQVTDSLEMQMEGQLIAVSKMETGVTVTYDEVIVSYESEVEVPVIGENPFFAEWGVFEISGVVSAARHRPVTFIRQCRKLERLLEEEDGSETNTGEDDGVRDVTGTDE